MPARDLRSKRVILLAHCLLNQNSVVFGKARRPGPVGELVKLLVDAGVGMVQLPCPELTHYGLRRFWAVKEQFDNPGFRARCRRIASEVAEVVGEYLRNGYEVLGFVGVNGSPSCGVREHGSGDWMGDPREAGGYSREPGPGIFVEELMRVLNVRFEEWDWRDVEGSLERIAGLMRSSQ
ncbi:MAG: hypothetical protein QI223_01485 [Candidatus Korarchaeota archaeon]|nr:hypothetical protein [Candidatus Korarchaeota archaeon]